MNDGTIFASAFSSGGYPVKGVGSSQRDWNG
jgi:hypothetical protein